MFFFVNDDFNTWRAHHLDNKILICRRFDAGEEITHDKVMTEQEFGDDMTLEEGIERLRNGQLFANVPPPMNVYYSC